ncbi:transposase [Desulfococcaceae bacterium HSG7]|nr:transposase [Desulfococcaceae bacterium HSG7]
MSIETGLTLRMVFQSGLRQTEGFSASIIKLTELPVTAPNYSTLCRRQSRLTIKRPSRTNAEPVHQVVDSTGVKVYGEGEWKVR